MPKLDVPEAFTKFPAILRDDASDSHQLAILFLDEHDSQEACDNCAVEEFKLNWRDKPYDVDVLNRSRITSAIDMARGEMLGWLCEMHEPPGRLVTRDHVSVQIDNELMFCSGAGANLWDCPWVKGSGRAKPSGIIEAINLCEQVLSLRDMVFREAIELPNGYNREEVDSIRRRARRFLRGAAR